MAEEKKVKEVFGTTLNAELKAHPGQWDGKASAAMTKAILTTRVDKDGNLVVLTAQEEDILQLASRPTHEVQVRVIRAILEAHGVTVDAETDKTIRRVVSPTAFKMELMKAGRIKDTSSDLSDLTE